MAPRCSCETRHGFVADLLAIPLIALALRYLMVGFRHAFIIIRWNGGAGNNIKQLTNAVVSAKREGGWMVILPLIHGPIHELLAPPRIIFMDGFGHSRSRGTWGRGRIEMWHGKDQEFPKEPQEEIEMRALLRSYFRPELAACVQQTPDDNLDSLTIHIRSGDIFRKLFYFPNHRQAPCCLFERIIKEGNSGRPFQHALVVTEPDQQNPCVAWLQMKELATTQSGSIAEDACAILRARNLVVARSSFSETLSRLNDRVQRVFTFSLKPCCCGGGVPEREVFRYEVPGVENMRMQVEENIHWLVNYNVEEVVGPLLCNASDKQKWSY